MRKEKGEFEEENKQWLTRLFAEVPFSQADIARRMKVTAPAVSRWKRTGQISGEHIRHLCKVLVCEPPDWLQTQNKENRIGQDRAEYQHLPKPLAEILKSYKAQDLSLDDLYSLLQISARLAGKNQKIKSLVAKPEDSDRDNSAETNC